MSEDTVQTADESPGSTYENLKITKSSPKDDNAYVQTFHVEYTDPDDGTLHTGSFTMARMTLGMRREQGTIKARLSGGLQVSTGADWLNEMLSTLAVALVKTPEWWDPENGYDFGLVTAMFNYVFAWEGSFRRKAVARRRG